MRNPGSANVMCTILHMAVCNCNSLSLKMCKNPVSNKMLKYVNYTFNSNVPSITHPLRLDAPVTRSLQTREKIFSSSHAE